MNQILITKKVIMTPEFKKKRRLYKINFFLSSFLACVLFSCCIYAEYDRNRSEQVSQDILLGIQENAKQEEIDTTTISVEDGVLVINELSEGIDAMEERQVIIDIDELFGNKNKTNIVESVAPDGKSYYTEAVLKIASLGIEYPVLSASSDELLKISVNKLWGPKPNEVGNYVIVGHNYRGGKMFGKLPTIKIGDTFQITDLSDRTITYKVYKTYEVDPSDVSCTSQLTGGRREVTLITCTSTGKKRFVVKAEAI